jgi:hypothetical protein
MMSRGKKVTAPLAESASFLVLNVFEGVARKIPWCLQPSCLPGGITQVNFYASTPCVNYCPYAVDGGATAKRQSEQQHQSQLCHAAVLLESRAAAFNESATLYMLEHVSGGEQAEMLVSPLEWSGC